MCLLRLQRAYRLHSLDNTDLSPPSSGASETNTPNLPITICWGENRYNLKNIALEILSVDVGLDSIVTVKVAPCSCHLVTHCQTTSPLNAVLFLVWIAHIESPLHRKDAVTAKFPYCMHV